MVKKTEIKLPFFSVVIPTKNRPDYLYFAIESVIRQNFSDYELIVSDNCNGQETVDLLNKYENHSKFRTIRPSKELNMLDHWEFATLEARGKYVIVLADRKLLYQNALKSLHRELIKRPYINVFSVGVKTYNDIEKKMGWFSPIWETKEWNTDELLKSFFSEKFYLMDKTYPKTLNGGYKNEYAKMVRRISGHYFNNNGVTTPDFSSFFINCILNTNSLYIGEPIILTQGEHTSNGRLFGRGKFKEYMDMLNIKNVYTNVPVKAPYIYNLLVCDFYQICCYFKKDDKDFKKLIDWNTYFTFLWNEYDLKKDNSDLTKEEINFFRDAILKGENRWLSNNEQKKIRQLLQTPSKNKSNLFYKIRDFINYRFSHLKIVNQIMKFRFSDGLKAAGF